MEQTVRIRSALSGLGYLFSHLAPLYLMCDLHDLGVYIEPRWKAIGNTPVILLYDIFPGRHRVIRIALSKIWRDLTQRTGCHPELRLRQRLPGLCGRGEQ